MVALVPTGVQALLVIVVLVTPALPILGYDVSVAIGSSMAFVLGTAVIATLKHHDVGQVDHRLGALMFVGIAVEIKVGRRAVFVLDELGQVEAVVGAAYVVLLAAIGLLSTRGGLNGEDNSGDTPADDDIPEVAERLNSYRIPPMVTLADGSEASLWVNSPPDSGPRFWTR